MIDRERLNEAYVKEGFYSLQLEVGDLCHQGCIYCYMNALDTQQNTLSDKQINNIIREAETLGITAVEWLGGEPLLRDSITDHMAFAAGLGLRNNVWTGGLPLGDDFMTRNIAKYAKKGLVAVHVSTVDPRVYERLHPGHGEKDLNIIIGGIERLLSLGYPAEQMLISPTFTGLQSSGDMIRTLDFFESNYRIKSSINVYHTYLRPGTPAEDLQKFIPGEAEVEKVYERYSEQWDMKEFPMNCVNKQYCSSTVAVLCDGSVTPCATIREPDAPNIHNGSSFTEIVHLNHDHLIFKKFRDPRHLPAACKTCSLSDECFGCRSRAYAAGKGIYGKDPRCFRSA